MKKKIIITLFCVLLSAALLAGCNAAAPNDATEEQVSQSTLAASAPQESAVTEATDITLEQAKATALAHAGLKAEDVTFTEAREEFDDGIWEYEIEFYAEGWEYDYTVHKADGSILKSEKERERAPVATATTKAAAAQATTKTPAKTTAKTAAKAGNVTLERAKEIALKDAGVASADATFLKARLEWDDGVQEYEIEFVSNGWEYEYAIHAGTGSILERDKERAEGQHAAAVTRAPHSAATDITLAKAKEIALKDAGLSASKVTFTKAKLDYDDGIQEYEIEFVHGDWEYEYSIHAGTGAILESDREHVWD